MIRSICIVSREYPPETADGGIGRVSEMTARGLVDHGVAVHVISLDRTGQGRRVLQDGVAVYRLPMPAGAPDRPPRGRAGPVGGGGRQLLPSPRREASASTRSGRRTTSPSRWPSSPRPAPCWPSSSTPPGPSSIPTAATAGATRRSPPPPTWSSWRSAGPTSSSPPPSSSPPRRPVGPARCRRSPCSPRRSTAPASPPAPTSGRTSSSSSSSAASSRTSDRSWFCTPWPSWPAATSTPASPSSAGTRRPDHPASRTGGPSSGR